MRQIPAARMEQRLVIEVGIDSRVALNMPKRFLVIVNPKSGLLHGADLASKAGSFFKSKGIDCTFYETRKAGDAGQ